MAMNWTYHTSNFQILLRVEITKKRQIDLLHLGDYRPSFPPSLCILRFPAANSLVYRNSQAGRYKKPMRPY